MDAASGERFTRQLIANRGRIYGFVFSLVPDHHLAEDLFQEVCAVLWRKFDAFEDGTNFAAWGIATARLTILEWRRKRKRLPIQLQDQQFEMLLETSIAMSDEFPAMREAMVGCLEELTPRQRQLLKDRYFHDEPVKAIAERWGRSLATVYKSLRKSHEALLHCVTSALAWEAD